MLFHSKLPRLLELTKFPPQRLHQNHASLRDWSSKHCPKILHLFKCLANMQKHPVLKTILVNKQFYVIPSLWNFYEMSKRVCPTSCQSEINSFPSFIGPKLWRPKIKQKLGEQLSWKRFIETTTCQQLVSVGNFQLILLSMQINIYCLLTNQIPALLVQCTPWTQVAVMLVQSLYFSRPPPPRAIIPNTGPFGTFENQDGHHLR